MKPLYLAAALLATSILGGQAMAAEHAKTAPVVEKTSPAVTTPVVEPKIEAGKDAGVVEDTTKTEGKVLEEGKTPAAPVAAEPATGTKPAHK